MISIGYGRTALRRETAYNYFLLNGIQEVVGSIPIGSTKFLKGLAGNG
jgi:hypothetical protein